MDTSYGIKAYTFNGVPIRVFNSDAVAYFNLSDIKRAERIPLDNEDEISYGDIAVVCRLIGGTTLWEECCDHPLAKEGGGIIKAS
ncbi:hypothetical protein FLM52_17600 [bacterium Scap17]|nr:hypothetical protein [bacterium Scap17]